MTGPLLGSLSVVMVVEHDPPAAGLLADLLAACTRVARDVEVILVANGVHNAQAKALTRLVAHSPQTICLFLSSFVDDDVARLVGLDNAIGDYLLFVRPTPHEIAAIPALAAAAAEGYDVVVAPPGAPAAGLYGVAQRGFLRIHRRLSGIDIPPGHGVLRLLSRPAALHISSRPDGEMLMRANALGAGFPAITVPVVVNDAPPPVAAGPRRRRLRDSAAKGMRALISATSLPLRLASMISLLTGCLSIVYSVYVVLVYLFAQGVAPGWTTLSLQLSMMMFLFSVVLMLLSEYIIQIHAVNPGRSRRVGVAREVRSDLMLEGGRLNVVDGEGVYQIGAPESEPVVATRNGTTLR